MNNLKINTPRTFDLGNDNSLPAAAGIQVFQGAAVSVNNAGDAKPLSAGERFVGFALEPCDNRRGTSGAKKVRVLGRGAAVLKVTGVTKRDIGKIVYATSDNDFTLIKVGNSKIGIIIRCTEDGDAVVEFYVGPA
jgi:hypothetical protein